jgi:hypothetical protein
VKTALLAAAAAALALVAADGATADTRVAYFKVSLVAKQDVSWTKNLTFPGCGGDKVLLQGKGSSAIRVRTPRAQPAVAQRLKGGRVTLRFRRGGALLPVAGTISRQGLSYATGGSSTGASCGRPEPPIASDCGTKQYPSDAAIGYYTPQDWPYDSGPTPLIPSIALSGPAAAEWRGIVFQWCPGANGDDVLRGPVYENEAAHSSPGGLAPAKLFGTLRSFRVAGHSRELMDVVKLNPSLIGSFPIKTETDWTLRFTRLAHRPSGL